MTNWTYADNPVASFGIKNRKPIGMKVQRTWMATPKGRLSKEPEEMFRTDATPAPTNDPNVDPKLFIDIKRANRVPSIPGGHSCPDKIRNGINLQFTGSFLLVRRLKWWITIYYEKVCTYLNWLIASLRAEPKRTIILSDIPYVRFTRVTKTISRSVKIDKPTWDNLHGSWPIHHQQNNLKRKE